MTPHWQFGRPWVRLAAALVPTFVLAMFLTNGSASIAVRVEAALVLVVTLVRPAIGLMIVALLAPLGDVVTPVFGGPPLRHAETLVVAFLAGWLLFRIDHDKSRAVLPANLTSAMWVFGSVLIASVAATAFQLRGEDPAAMQSTVAMLTQSYLLNAYDPVGVQTAGRLLEGLGLMAAAAEIGQHDTRDRIRLLACLVASGAVAGIASGLFAIGIAPAQTLARHTASGLARYSAATADVNAAASSSLLLVGVALGVATVARRARLTWVLAAATMLAALALTSSGSALIAGTGVLAVISVRWITSSTPRLKIVGALVLVLMVGSAIAFTGSARSISSLEMRRGFTTASVRLISAAPVFGIGAGRYYPLSTLVLPPWLSVAYGSENAHNYYLQTAAELGVLGVVAFVWVLGSAAGAQIKRVWHGRAEGLIVGCVCGAIAYLVTALSGHPFLVAESAVPFWVVSGALVMPPTIPAIRSTWRGRVTIVCSCAVLLTAPARGIGWPIRLPLDDYGFGPWQRDNSGEPFREAEALSSLVVRPAVTSVEIPMRLGGDSAGSALVAVTALGPFRSETHITGEWTKEVVRLPGAEALVPGQRINLSVSLVGDGPPRRPRLDIGQIRILSVR
jgi:hypothetical protein